MTRRQRGERPTVPAPTPTLAEAAAALRERSILLAGDFLPHLVAHAAGAIPSAQTERLPTLSSAQETMPDDPRDGAGWRPEVRA